MIELTLYSLLFILVWVFFYRDVVPFHRGIILIFLTYIFELFLFMKLFNGLGVGTAGNFDLILSQILAILFTDGLIYVELSLVAYHFLGIRSFIAIFLIQSIFVIFCVLLSDRIYHTIFRPIKCLYIYGGDDNDVLNKLEKYQNSNFEIVKQVNEKDFNYDTAVQEINGFEQIILANTSQKINERIVRICYNEMKSVIIEPTIYDVIINKGSDIHLIDTPLLKVNHFGPTQLEKPIKRIFDILFSLTMIILFSPIFLIVALAVKLQDGGPVFYKQTRLTQYGKEFKIIKFRSMKINAEADGKAVLAKEGDSRITPVGRFIRKCRLDELPQFVNILIGDMSVVGPRPERPEIAKEIMKDLPEFRLRLMVKAGLTGYAQIYGKYNTTLHDKLLLDLQYIEDFSLILDIKLILMTLKIIFMKDSTEGI